MDTEEIVENRVREIRRRRGMRQEDLAREVGVSRQTIIAIERGKMVNPTIVTCLRLARVLQEPLDYLFFLTRVTKRETEKETRKDSTAAQESQGKPAGELMPPTGDGDAGAPTHEAPAPEEAVWEF